MAQLDVSADGAATLAPTRFNPLALLLRPLRGVHAWRRRRRARIAAARAVTTLPGYSANNFWKSRRRTIYIALAIFAFLYGFAFALLAPALLVPLVTPLVPLVLLVIWLLPDFERPPDGLLSRLTFAFVVALLCWPDYLAVVIPGLPWITAIRLIGIPLALVMLIATSTSHSFRSSISDTLKHVPLLWRPLVGFAVLAGLSIIWSTDRTQSISKFVIAQLYWTSIFLHHAMYSRPQDAQFGCRTSCGPS